MIDFIAVDVTALLVQAHGRSVQMNDGSKRELDTRTAQTVPVDPDWRTRVLSIVTEPTVAYLLLLLGIYRLYFELTSPGFGVPGVAGAISLLLGMFALQMLPVSYAGVALIVLGFALLVAEALLPSFGALGVGGIIAFVIGSVMLLDTDVPGFGIPPGLIAAFTVLNKAVEKAGYKPGEEVFLALDCAGSGIYDKGKYELKLEKKTLTSDELIDVYESWIRKYTIISIEDGLDENDWAGWIAMTARLGSKVQIIGDDVFVTNIRLLQRAIREKAANAILIKLNQIGTVTRRWSAMSWPMSATSIRSFRIGPGIPRIRSSPIWRLASTPARSRPVPRVAPNVPRSISAAAH